MQIKTNASRTLEDQRRGMQNPHDYQVATGSVFLINGPSSRLSSVDSLTRREKSYLIMRLANLLSLDDEDAEGTVTDGSENGNTVEYSLNQEENSLCSETDLSNGQGFDHDGPDDVGSDRGSENDGPQIPPNDEAGDVPDPNNDYYQSPEIIGCRRIRST